MAIVLICPPQSAPPTDPDSNLFSRLWWLFFYELTKRVLALSNRSAISADLAADYVSTAAFLDIGLSVNLTETGLYEITANLDWSVDVNASQVQMQLVVNDIVQAGIAGLFIGAASVRASCAYTWYYQNTGVNVAKLQNQKIAPGGAGKVFKDNTGLRVKFLG